MKSNLLQFSDNHQFCKENSQFSNGELTRFSHISFVRAARSRARVSHSLSLWLTEAVAGDDIT